MKEEIKESVEFLSRYLFKNFTENELNEVKESLSEILQERFNGHWYEDKPMKGQAYRSIRYRRFDKELDPVFDCLFKRCKNIFDEKFQFPFQDFTLWIDPGEVSCRFGDSISNSHIIACFDLTKRQKEQRKEVVPDIKPQPQVADVFEFFIPSDVLNTNEEFEKQPQQQQQQVVIENNHINNSMSHLTINDYFSCSPSSLSSSSFSSNASDGTCTPVSYYGDNNSERSETPSSLTNISLNELTSTPPQNQQISTSPSKSNGGAYCGYVESYPYYYKLNRLYNALAIQKLQTEKFKKIMRNKQQQYSQQSSPASKSPSTTPAPQTTSTTTTTKTTSIQIPQQQRGQKTNKQNPTRRTYQQKSPPKQSTLVDAYSPIAYQQYNHHTPPQFMIPNSYYPMVNNTDLLMPNVQNTLAASSILTTQTTTNDQTNSATNNNNNNNNNTLFDTMNWLRGPDLVKSKN